MNNSDLADSFSWLRARRWSLMLSSAALQIRTAIVIVLFGKLGARKGISGEFLHILSLTRIQLLLLLLAFFAVVLA